MAKRRMTGRPKAIGYSDDKAAVAISFPTAQGEFLLEVPFDQMQALGHLMAQILQGASEFDGLALPPSPLPTMRWEAGAGKDLIVLRLTVTGGGSYPFYLSRDFAAQLRDGIDAALSLPPEEQTNLN